MDSSLASLGRRSLITREGSGLEGGAVLGSIQVLRVWIGVLSIWHCALKC